MPVGDTCCRAPPDVAVAAELQTQVPHSSATCSYQDRCGHRTSRPPRSSCVPRGPAVTPMATQGLWPGLTGALEGWMGRRGGGIPWPPGLGWVAASHTHTHTRSVLGHHPCHGKGELQEARRGGQGVKSYCRGRGRPGGCPSSQEEEPGTRFWTQAYPVLSSWPPSP